MFERQLQHWMLLGLLLAGCVGVCVLRPEMLAGEWMGVSTPTWLAWAIFIPVLHQVYVWFIWRTELHYHGVSCRFGMERGFQVYAAGFAVLFAARLLLLCALAWSSRNTLPLEPDMAIALAIILTVPWAYTIYSVFRYFGLRRAFGIDHFDPGMRATPFVRQGMFRFTNNAMYGPGFLIVWMPGLLLRSEAALLVGAFNHLYIWVHYFVTELPDIRRIYGSSSDSARHTT